MSTATAPKLPRFIAGDALRGTAALAVVAYHCALFAVYADGLGTRLTSFHLNRIYGPLQGDVLRSLGLSVNVFLVLSGYLLSRPFIQAFVRGTPQPRLGAYLRNRLLRILPAFWVVLGASVAIYGMRGANLGELLRFATFSDDWKQQLYFGMPQAWTVRVEMHFYLLMPLVALAIAAAGRRVSPRGRSAMVITVATLLAAAGLSAHWNALPFYITLPGMLNAFLPGIVLAAIEPHVAPRLHGNPRVGRRVTIVAAIAIFVAFFYETLTSTLGPGPANIVATFCTGMIVAAPMLRQWAGATPYRWLEWPIWGYFGRRSYGIYLVHWLVLLQLLDWLGGHIGGYRTGLVILFPVALAISTALAEIIHRLIERPFLERKRPWARPAAPPQAKPSPAAV